MATAQAEADAHGDVVMVGEPADDSGQSQRVLAGFAAAVQLEADFVVVTRDGMLVNIPALSAYLASHRRKGNMYAGCMKSGHVVFDPDAAWYEPAHSRFGDADGDKLQYPRHASGEFYLLSRQVALHLVRSRAVLFPFAFEDTSFGAWLLGLDVQHVDEPRLCCNMDWRCDASSPPALACVATSQPGCGGVCDPEHTEEAYGKCISGTIAVNATQTAVQR